jgi:hypothetical protein
MNCPSFQRSQWTQETNENKRELQPYNVWTHHYYAFPTSRIAQEQGEEEEERDEEWEWEQESERKREKGIVIEEEQRTRDGGWWWGATIWCMEEWK